MWSVISVELTLSRPMPPYSSGMSTDAKPRSAALRMRPARTPGSLASMARGRLNLLAGEAGRRGSNLALLLVEVFRGEDFGGGAGFEQETAAGGGNDGGCGLRLIGSFLQRVR